MQLFWRNWLRDCVSPAQVDTCSVNLPHRARTHRQNIDSTSTAYRQHIDSILYFPRYFAFRLGAAAAQKNEYFELIYVLKTRWPPLLAIAFSAKIRSRLWKNQYAIDMLPICCRYAFDMLSVCCWKIVIQRHGRSRANVTCLHHRFVMHEASSKKVSESVGGHNPAPPAGASVLSNLINEPIHQ